MRKMLFRRYIQNCIEINIHFSGIQIRSGVKTVNQILYKIVGKMHWADPTEMEIIIVSCVVSFLMWWNHLFHIYDVFIYLFQVKLLQALETIHCTSNLPPLPSVHDCFLPVVDTYSFCKAAHVIHAFIPGPAQRPSSCKLDGKGSL